MPVNRATPGRPVNGWGRGSCPSKSASPSARTVTSPPLPVPKVSELIVAPCRTRSSPASTVTSPALPVTTAAGPRELPACALIPVKRASPSSFTAAPVPSSTARPRTCTVTVPAGFGPKVAELIPAPFRTHSEPASLDDGEQDWFRVEAGAGRTAGTGIYDLCFHTATGGWSLARVLD